MRPERDYRQLTPTIRVTSPCILTTAQGFKQFKQSIPIPPDLPLPAPLLLREERNYRRYWFLTALLSLLPILGLMHFYVLSQSLSFNFERPLIHHVNFQNIVSRTEHSVLGLDLKGKDWACACLLSKKIWSLLFHPLPQNHYIAWAILTHLQQMHNSAKTQVCLKKIFCGWCDSQGPEWQWLEDSKMDISSKRAWGVP